MKILIIDIETAPNIADVWDLWNQNVSLNQLRSSSYTLCWAAQWYGSDEMMFGAIWTHRNFIEEAHALLSEADAAVTYNGDRFDLPTLNKEFILEGMGPPAPYKSIDIYKTVKAKFKFASSKLDYVARQLGVGSKVKHEGHELWVKVMADNYEAQLDMEEYCKGDVRILGRVYGRVLPWIPGHPSFTLYTGSECPRCNDGDLERRGYAYTQVGQFQRYRCRNCGGWSRDTRRLEGVSIAAL